LFPMSAFRKHIFIFLTALFFFIRVIAQENYRVVNWNMEQGMSNGFVRCMIKDLHGFLWIGTQAGLDRLDGKSFKIFLPDENDPKSLLNKNIRGLIEDSLHNIWIGTDEGLSRYDIKADTFTNFLPQVSTPGSNNRMIPFWATRDELFCLEALSKITVYNIHSLLKKTTIQHPHKFEDNNSPRIQDLIYEEGSDAVWRLPENFEATGGGLYRLNLSTGKEDHFDWPCFRNIKNHFHWAEGMCYDRLRNSIWINNVEGLMQFTLSDKQFHYMDAVKNIHSPAPAIHMDFKDRVWVGTTNRKGLFIFDPATGSASIPFPDDSSLQKNINDRNLKIYCDRDGLAWIVYWTQKGLGINQLVPFSPAATRYSYQDQFNILDTPMAWDRPISTKDLKGVDKKKNFNLFTADQADRKGWLVDNENHDLKQLDIPTHRCKAVIIKNAFGQMISHVGLKGIYYGYFITRFKKKVIFWGVKPDKSEAIFMFDKDSAIAREILELPDVQITNIIADDDHIIIKTKNKLIPNLIYSYLNGSFSRTKTPLDSMAWTAIVSNMKDSSWWIAIDRELVHYKKNFRIIQTYTAKEVVPAGNDIYNLLIDVHDNIWFNTNRSLVRLDPSTGKLISLSEKDGFQPQQYNIFTVYPIKVEGGDFIMMGGYQGADHIKPGRLRETYPWSNVYLKSLEVNQKVFPLSTGINDLQELTLKYFQNKVNIETGIIDYYSNGNSHLRYKLDKRDSNWQNGAYYNTIRYEGLPAGDYRLIMQASNAVNDFNGPEKILLIHIRPAFWNTWWFRITVGFCTIALFYSLIRWRLQQKFHLQLESSEKEKQLADLRHKTAEFEMQALRAQMNPHFIFNSLNSINRFILRNDKVQASEYLIKFSKLVRLILQNSQASLISLESELEALELYISLESLRFDNRFRYKISVAPDLDISMLKIPPLIIQPYVENAIWHGLMHKEERGQLDIEISQENNYLFIKIADDGVGRQQSVAFGSKSATLHKSMGLRITADRIAVLQLSDMKDSSVIINDLANPDGSAAGTEVTIKIPVLYD